jgi:phosphoribosyl 1,2-cyclic phosphodiesterase
MSRMAHDSLTPLPAGFYSSPRVTSRAKAGKASTSLAKEQPATKKKVQGAAERPLVATEGGEPSAVETDFLVRFWGVRGSIPVPGPTTAGIGGNTSCVEVRCGKNVIIFDAGTGLRLLGNSLFKEMPLAVHLFFSHVHWDHIQGFPFFAPAFIPGNTIYMYGGKNVSGTVETALAGQMEMPNFPVHLTQLPAKLAFNDLHEGEVVEIPGGCRITNAAGNHPGGVYAYRVDYRGKSIIYATDTEHYSIPDPKLVALAKNADLLIFDSMYTPEEYAGTSGGGPKTGWGHSHFEAGVDLCKAAGIKNYLLFHHDPGQNDAAVREKERRARAIFTNAQAAYEGLTIYL